MKKHIEDDMWSILHSLALERKRPKWWQVMFGRRWYIDDEPLRHDAARVLRLSDVKIPKPKGTQYVGD